MRPHGGRALAVDRWVALRQVGVDIVPDRWSITPGAAILQENGWVVQSLPFDRALPAARIHIHAAEANFERDAAVVATDTHGALDPFGEVHPSDRTAIVKVTLGPVAVEQTAVAPWPPAPAGPSSRSPPTTGRR